MFSLSFLRNNDKIVVFEDGGSLSLPAQLALEAWKVSGDSHMIFHVAPPSKSFLVQQAMVLHKMTNGTSQKPPPRLVREVQESEGLAR